MNNRVNSILSKIVHVDRFHVAVVVIMVLSAFSDGTAAEESGKVRSESVLISRWAGSYDSVSGRCGELVVRESKITWGSCKEANIKLISVSASELVLAVDPSAAQCGWAGFIVALGNDETVEKSKTADRPVKTISAYQSLDDYKAGNRFVQCSYFRKE